MKKIMAVLAVLALGVSAKADVHFSGLYHNNTNLNVQTEAVPSFPANRFLEVHYDQTNVAIHFLTASPAGDAAESVETSVRIYSTHLETPSASFVANIVLEPTNQFHGAVAAGTFPLDLWRVNWAPPHGFTGTVYYAPHILTRTNGVQTDQQYLLTSIGANVGAQWGDNSLFYTTNAQFVGDDPFGLDYSFVWTNLIPLNFDFFYYNNTGVSLPENESVPGLGGEKFFQYNYDPGMPSYVYLLAPHFGLSSLQTRFDFINGGGEVYRTGEFYTNVVIDAGAPFHGLPLAGAITVDVWRTAFYPPSGWSNNTVYYSQQITTPQDGTTWLVTDQSGFGSGIGATNNWNLPQYFWTDGPYFHDWGFAPTSGIVRESVERDYLYHNNTNLNPQTEAVPGVGGATFLKVNYATTTTTFYVITDHPVNAVPGETVYVQIRIDYDNPEYGYNAQYYNMAFDQNLVIDSGTPFHGLPSSGSHTVDLWRFDWPQPRSTNAPFAPFTNNFTVYYAPFLKTTFGQDQYQTDYTYLLADSTFGAANSYPTQPQQYGPDNFSHDYAYVHQFVLGPDADGDGMPDAWEVQYFGTTTNGATGDNDTDGLDNFGEYIADTNPTNGLSLFGPITNSSVVGTTLHLVVNPSSTARVYDAYAKTNLLTGTGWAPYGLSVTGNGALLQLTVTNTLDRSNFRTGVHLP